MEVFSGNVLTDIICYFEKKFKADGSEDRKLTDCFRAYVAILNCAGKLDKDKIEGLRAHVIGELAKSSTISAEKRSNANFSSYASLLCAWGMADEVSDCLANSISYYFDNGENDEQAVEFTQKATGTKKRKPRGKKGAETKSLPRLPIDVSLGILGHVLNGTFPASASARESILKTDNGFDVIIVALQKAQVAADSLLRPRIVSWLLPLSTGVLVCISCMVSHQRFVLRCYSQNYSQSEVNIAAVKNIGNAIECYGRLILHNEATKDEFPMRLSVEASSLMTWISESIVPSFVKMIDQNDTLRDLDISGISGIDSPMSNAPPKRKSTRNSSFLPMFPRFSETAIPEDDPFNVYQEHTKFTRTAAICAMKSVLCIITEWIDVRGIVDPSVSNHVTKWCKVLKCSDDTVKKTLLPIFSRLALLCLKNDADSSLSKELLLCLENDGFNSSDEKVIAEFVSTLAFFRDTASIQAFIRVAVQATSSGLQKLELNNDEAESDKPFIDKVGACMKSVLMCVFRESKTSLALAQYLANEAKFLSVRSDLFKELLAHAPKTPAMNKVLSQWKRENAIVEDEDAEDESADGDDSDEIVDEVGNDFSLVQPEMPTAVSA